MKIAMIGHKRIPGREGGIEVVVEELAAAMSAAGHDVTAYNRKSKKVQHPLRDYKGVKIITIPTIEKKSTDAIVYSFLASIHATFSNYDIIHYHALGPSVMLLIPHLFGKKTVVTVHGLNYKTPKWKGLGEKVIRFGEWVSAKFADEIIVLSKEQKEYFLKKYNRQTVFVPNGVRLKEIRINNEISKKWNLTHNGYILFLSRLVPGKGLEHLIQAYKQIDTDIPLIIAGESIYVNDFYEKILTEVNADKRIKMVGFVDGTLLEELYANARVFVFPSEAEGMPMCLLEALSYNTRCLVSDIPENVDVGASYVDYFKVANVFDLKEHLIKAINEQSAFGDSRSYVRENYDWNQVTNQTLKCYEELLNKCH